jgi:tyrosinase
MEKTVEMIMRGDNTKATWRNQRLARRTSYRFNVKPERIKLVKQTELTLRKNEAKMSDPERQKFKDAILDLISDSSYAMKVAIHVNECNRMHTGLDSTCPPLPISTTPGAGQQRFLPWHRVYLWEFETLLINKNPDCFIPYWDWTTNPGIPDWLKDFVSLGPPPKYSPGQLPMLWVVAEDADEPKWPVHVMREPGDKLGGSLPLKTEVDNLENRTDLTYTDFTEQLEDFHNNVHNWVGGTMRNPQFSPADPLFWLLHANIDRIWSIWQKNNSGKNPSLGNEDGVMDPWMDWEEPQTRNISQIGYTYG